jgi:hypothetical protein
MLQLILHLVGDYLLQSEHMAERKRSSSVWAGIHAVTYALPFWLLHPSWAAWSVICGSHFLIDRFGLARYLVWAKNVVLGLWPMWLLDRIERDADLDERWKNDCRRLSWENCRTTGYPAELQPWQAAFLIIVADNAMHLAINWVSLEWL